MHRRCFFTRHAVHRAAERIGRPLTKQLRAFIVKAIEEGRTRTVQHHVDGSTLWLEIDHGRQPIRFAYDRDQGKILTFLPTVKIGTPVLSPDDLK
jgi:hypothetical protein